MTILRPLLLMNGHRRNTSPLEVPGVLREETDAGTLWGFSEDGRLVLPDAEWMLSGHNFTPPLDLANHAYMIYCLEGEDQLRAVAQEDWPPVGGVICPIAWVDSHHDLTPRLLTNPIPYILLAQRAFSPGPNPYGQYFPHEVYGVNMQTWTLLADTDVAGSGVGTARLARIHFSLPDRGTSTNRVACRGRSVLAIAGDGQLWSLPDAATVPGTLVTFPTLMGVSDPAGIYCLGVNRSVDGSTWWALVEYIDYVTPAPAGTPLGYYRHAFYALTSTARTPTLAADWTVGYTVVPPIVQAVAAGGDIDQTQVAGIGGTGATLVRVATDGVADLGYAAGTWLYRTPSATVPDGSSYLDATGLLGSPFFTPPFFYPYSIEGTVGMKFDQEGGVFLPQGIIGHPGAIMDRTGQYVAENPWYAGVGDGAGGLWGLRDTGDLSWRNGPFGTPWTAVAQRVIYPDQVLSLDRAGSLLYVLHAPGTDDNPRVTEIDVSGVAGFVPFGGTMHWAGSSCTVGFGLPVCLTSFTATASGTDIVLTLTTDTDISISGAFVYFADETGAHFGGIGLTGATYTVTVPEVRLRGRQVTAYLAGDSDPVASAPFPIPGPLRLRTSGTFGGFGATALDKVGTPLI